VKKKHTPACPEFWYGRGKILVKKVTPPVCKMKSPEFWYGRGKILVKKKKTPSVVTVGLGWPAASRESFFKLIKFKYQE
jgi:hypothetical protein